MTPEDLELHRRLLVAFNDYLSYTALWEEKKIDRHAIRARVALRRMIDISYLRWKELNNERKLGQPEELIVGREFFRDVGRSKRKKRTE